ncbi:hypothetical protein J6590_078366, partial [Homalodisca vitripennis]
HHSAPDTVTIIVRHNDRRTLTSIVTVTDVKYSHVAVQRTHENVTDYCVTEPNIAAASAMFTLTETLVFTVIVVT